MNETLENIMIFINENTNILIGICVFLIFVLVCYLIDNSIKSRKAKKEFKKSKEIKLEAATEVKPEPVKEVETQVVKEEPELPKNLFEEAVSISEKDITLNETENNDVETPTDNIFEEAVSKNDTEIKIDEDVAEIANVINTIESQVQEPKNVEPVVEEKADVLYKNDKKLSEILFSDAKKEEQSEQANFEEISNNTIEENIFDDSKISVKNMMPEKVESKVEIELGEDALDNIMKKLKNISSVEEDDSYTNIF